MQPIDFVCRRFDRLALWWLRKRNPKRNLVMLDYGEYLMHTNYNKLTGPEHS